MYVTFLSRWPHSSRPAVNRSTQGIPDKGKLLTQLSLFWFEKLQHIIPNHFVTADVEKMPEEIRQYKGQLAGRTMLVKKAEVIPLEAIVRGYLSGSLDRSFSTRI